MEKLPRELKPYAEKITKDQRRKIRRRQGWRYNFPLVVLILIGLVVTCFYTFLNGLYWESLFGIISVCFVVLLIYWLRKLEDDSPRVE